MRGSLVSSLANLDHVDLLGHARAPVDRRLFSWPPCRKAQLAPSADLAASVSQTMNPVGSRSFAFRRSVARRFSRFAFARLNRVHHRRFAFAAVLFGVGIGLYGGSCWTSSSR
jgi:hypothetical protein